MTDLFDSNWSETDASNNTAPPAGWPAGMLPSAVEPTARMMMGAIKRWLNFSNPVYTTAGTASALTLTPTVAISAYTHGQTFDVILGSDVDATATFNVSGKGAKKIYVQTQAGLRVTANNDARTTNRVRLSYDSTLDTAAGGFVMRGQPLQGAAEGLVLTANGADLEPTFQAAAGGSSNILINGGMQVNQRVVTTGAASSAQCFDMWVLLTQTASITVAQQTLQENGTPYNIRLTQAQASAQRIGLLQKVESINAQQVRGQALSLNARVRISSSQPIRYAILEWTGTADSLTNNPVNDWTSASYTAGGFFSATTTTVTAVGAMTPSANTWTTLSTLTGTCGSSTNNLYLFIWTEGTAAQNVTLDISRVQCAIGSSLGAFVWENISATLAKCQRYYFKTFPQATAPAQNAGTAGTVRSPQVVAASAANSGGIVVSLPVTMRTDTPTVTIYNPSAANAFPRNSTIAADCSAPGSVSTANSAGVIFTAPAASAAGNAIQFHMTVDGSF